MPRDRLIALVRDMMRGWFIEGSDPGLAVADAATDEMMAFAARAKVDLVTQADARAVAAPAGCVLEGLGGTEQGIMGALAAVALAHGGDDGRVVHIQGWPWLEALSGVQPVAAIRERGMAEILPTTGGPFTGGMLDVGKHLRPSWRGGRPVLFLDPEPDIDGIARAARLKSAPRVPRRRSARLAEQLAATCRYRPATPGTRSERRSPGGAGACPPRAAVVPQ